MTRHLLVPQPPVIMHFSNFVAATSEKTPRNVIHSPRRSVFGSILWWKSRVVIHSDFMRGREYAERLIKDGDSGDLRPCGQSLMKPLPGALKAVQIVGEPRRRPATGFCVTSRASSSARFKQREGGGRGCPALKCRATFRLEWLG